MTLGKMLQLMVGSVGLRFAGAGLGLVTQLVLTRNFSPSDVGVIFLGMSMAAVLSMVAAVGYPLLALTQLPRFFTLGVGNLVRAFHGAFLRDLAVALVLILVGILIATLGLAIDRGLKIALIFGGLSALPSAFLRYNSMLANGLRRYQLAFVPDFIFRPGLFFLYIIAAFALGVQPSVPHVLAAFVFSNTIVAIGQTLILRGHGVRLSDWMQVRPLLSHVLRRRAMALAVVGAVTVMFADIVTLLGGFILPHDEVAILGLTIRLAGIAGFVIQATQQFILPDLTQALTRQNDKLADELLVRLNLLTALTLALGLLVTIFFGGFFLSFFGEVYRTGQWLLVLFLVGQSTRALSGMNQNLLSIGGHQVRSAGACLTGLFIFTFAAIIFTNLLGFMGIGYAAILAELIWAVMLAVQVQSLMGRRADLLWLFQKI
jgi:O-antigen/teichoic acid export membrane protein